jgi:hypothetical protein
MDDFLVEIGTSGRKQLMRAWILLSGTILLAALAAPAVHAQDTAEVKRLTIMTFSEPVQLPGMTLPAGKYRFEMADINNAAHTVRVLSEDGQKVLGTFHTIPTVQATRDLSDTDTLVMFSERPAGQPQAAKEWYYPQRSIGEEFVYPREQALAIAKANNTTVPAEDGGKIERVGGSDAAAATDTAAGDNAAAANDRAEVNDSAAANNRDSEPSEPAAASQPEQRVAQNDPAPAPAPEPNRTVGTSGQEATPESNRQVGTAGQAPAQSEAPARTLPQTASNLYFYELLSMLLLASAVGIHQLRRQGSQA